MTNCLAPYNEASSIYKAYNSNGMLSSAIGFIIPVYENMPQYATDSPNILDSDYETDNTNVYADITGSLNVRAGPSTIHEVLTTVTKDNILTRIKKGVQSGERWDKVLLENGMVGYVFQSYLKEVPKPSISSIELNIDNNIINKGSNNNISINIKPDNAVKEGIIWESSNEEVVSVNNGIITGISSGKATIIAKSPDGTVSGSIEITVYTPVNEILLSKNYVTLLIRRYN